MSSQFAVNLRKLPTRWWLAIGLLIVVLSVFYACAPTFQLDYPLSGPWRTRTDKEDRLWDALRDSGYRAIAEQTGINPSNGSGLKIFYDWPRRKWLAFSMPETKQPQLAVLDLDPISEAANLRTFAIPRDRYIQFMRDFDAVSSGYRIGSFGADGESFTYERWDHGISTHYSGNASFNSKDEQVKQLVEHIVAQAEAANAGNH